MSPALPSSALPLGTPLPIDEHACSVSLPTWCSVVGYEEGSPSVTEKLACGYPRFVYHPYIMQLMGAALESDKSLRKITGEFECIVLPSKQSALRCHDFLAKACGYYDGNVASPRLVDDKEIIEKFVGESRVALFSDDNAINVDIADDQIYNEESPIRMLNLGVADVHAVIFPSQPEFAAEAKCYWQHTGEVLSSRRAEVALSKLGLCKKCQIDDSKQGLKRVTSAFHPNGKADDEWSSCPHTDQMHAAKFPSNLDDTTSSDPFLGVQERIASIVDVSSSSVFLTPSGMATIYGALRSARRRTLENDPLSMGGKSIVYGFPYLDTLKMCSRPEFVPKGVTFYGHGDEEDLNNFENMLRKSANENNGNAGVSVVMTEFPSNPLLKSPDLYKLRALADEFDFALVVDDTIGNFANLNLIESGLADVVCTSLTKLFNGRGDAMAGSIVTNPNTEIGRWMQRDLSQNHINHEGLWNADAHAVDVNSVDFLERSSKINQTTEALVDWLIKRDEIASLYYPKYTNREGYEKVLKKDDYNGKHKPGYGGLFSIVLDEHICDRSFFDKINLSKGPSLGTNFSLSCPYTLLAHYHELDFTLAYGVQPNLIRFSIGLESFEEMKEKFETALNESRLHPKLPKTVAQVRGYCTSANMKGLSSQLRTGMTFNRSHHGFNFGLYSTPFTSLKKRHFATSSSAMNTIQTSPIETTHLNPIGSQLRLKKSKAAYTKALSLLRKL